MSTEYQPKAAIISVAGAAIALPKGIAHSIQHNAHHYACSLADWLDFLHWQGDMSVEDRAECLRTNELWSIQVYQTTPGVFIRGMGPTFERALQNLNENR